MHPTGCPPPRTEAPAPRSPRLRRHGFVPSLVISLALVAAMAPQAWAAVLFEDDFDAQRDWHSGMIPNGQVAGGPQDGIPAGWYSVSQRPEWAPSTGHPDRNEAVEVLGSNADKAMGGSGKSAVFHREAYGGSYTNDKIMAYRIPGGSDEVYVEFYIRFSPNWYIGQDARHNASKLFRIYAWDESDGQLTDFGANGDAGPLMFWNYGYNSTYGSRNQISLRGVPTEQTYFLRTPQGFPRQLVNGDSSLSWTTNLLSEARLTDYVNGGLLTDDADNIVWHDQVYGPPSLGIWTKVAFHVRMNSRPGAADGVYTQWINGQRTIHNENVVWTAAGFPLEPWDIVALGGNDYIDSYPRSARYKEWYAFDEVRIHDSVPSDVARVDPRSGQQGGAVAGGMCIVR